MNLPAHIAERIRRWVADAPKEGGHVDSEAARHGGISLLGTIGSVWLLRPDGTFWESDDDSGTLSRLPKSHHLVALGWGVQSHPWLAELLPPRPPDAADCVQCRGQGKVQVGSGGTAGFACCHACDALGWIAC